MGRLVDIDDVIPVISNHHFDEDKNDFDLLIHNLCKEVKKIPTAYDVEKVVAELEDMSGIQYDCSYGRGCEFDDCIHTPKAIDIVRKGGAE